MEIQMRENPSIMLKLQYSFLKASEYLNYIVVIMINVILLFALKLLCRIY